MMLVSLLITLLTTTAVSSVPIADDAGWIDPPFMEPLPGTRTEVVFNSSGIERVYVVYIPSTLSPNQPAPLVFSFHGRGSTSRQQELLCFFSVLAEEHQFIAVYPEGIDKTFNAGELCCGSGEVDDVQYTLDMIEDINNNHHPVNRSRIYSTGMSNGGYMSVRLGCELSHVFAAIANVAGASPWSDFLANCLASRPIPYLHFHGDADTTVVYSSAERVVDGFLTINGCNKNTNVMTYNYGDSSCVAYTQDCYPHGGSGLNNVTFCTTVGGRHAWPGNPVYQGGTLDLQASPHIIDFFLRFSL